MIGCQTMDRMLAERLIKTSYVNFDFSTSDRILIKASTTSDSSAPHELYSFFRITIPTQSRITIRTHCPSSEPQPALPPHHKSQSRIMHLQLELVPSKHIKRKREFPTHKTSPQVSI